MKLMLFCVTAILLLVGCGVYGSEFLIGDWQIRSSYSKEDMQRSFGAGFNTVLIDAKNSQSNKSALEMCAEAGVKGVVADPRIQPMKNSADGFKEAIDAVIADYAASPAFVGYFIADAPGASLHIKLADVSRYLREKDPVHPSYTHLLPASSQSLEKSSFEYYVDEHARAIQPKYLSLDNYSDSSSGFDGYINQLETLRKLSIKNKTQFNVCLKTLPDGKINISYRDYLCGQIYTALAYGARGIVYFKDKSVDQRKYLQIARINREVGVLADTLVRLKQAAVYHTGSVPVSAKALPKTGLISEIVEGEFVVGQFISSGGSRYAMFVNKSDRTHRPKIFFNQHALLYEVDPANGEERRIKVKNIGDRTVWIGKFFAGHGRLVRIETPQNRPVEGWEDMPVFRYRVMLNPSNQFKNVILGDNKEQLYNEGMNMYLVAEKVKKYLEADGRVDVFMTRGSQAEPSTLQSETELTRNLNCDILFSLHSDATGTAEPGGGCWTFYCEDRGKMLGESIDSQLIESIRSFYPEVLSRGVRAHWIRLWVIHEAGCPAVLTEFLFHSNPKEREMLKDPQAQETMAKAAAQGILDYLFKTK